MKTSYVLAAAVTVFAASVQAQSNEDHASHHAQAVSGASASSMEDGEVRKVDREQGKVTLKHGPIPNLDMPDMTMVFRVQEPAMLDRVKAGDKVRFSAQKVGGQYTVVRLEAAP